MLNVVGLERATVRSAAVTHAVAYAAKPQFIDTFEQPADVIKKTYSSTELQFISWVQDRCDEAAAIASSAPHYGKIDNGIRVVGEATDDFENKTLGLAAAHYIVNRTVDWSGAWAAHHAIYRPENDGKYPLRQADGAIARITKIGPRANLRSPSTACVSAKVLPFIRSTVSEAERAKLYSGRLECRKLTPADFRPGAPEAAMAGENGVFATQDIADGECLGVYGGTLLNNRQRAFVRSATYMMCIVDDEPKAALNRVKYLDGDNVLSRINTIFDFDQHGIPTGQAKRGYNVDAQSFDAVITAQGETTKIKLPIYVATRIVKKGEQLLVNYNYTPEIIQSEVVPKILAAKASR